jgi:hypothetical protein
MTKDELIAKQQIEIEDLKARLKENATLKRKIKGMCFAIGAPLNDNILQMNKDQLKWCFQIAELGEQINGL